MMYVLSVLILLLLAGFGRQKVRNLKLQKEMQLHDLKNTLNVIQGLAEKVARNKNNIKTMQSYAELLENSCATALVQIEQIFAAKQVDNQSAFFGCRDVLLEICDVWKKTLPKNIRFTSKLPKSDVFIYGNSLLLRRMLNNLLQNAERALPKGGHIHVECKEVLLTAEKLKLCQIKGKKGKCLAVSVEDDGSGIDLCLWRKLFKPYVTLRFGQGSGLGLPMLKMGLKAFDASLKIENKSTGGCRFIVYFPCVKINCQNVKILVVDDDVMQCTLLKEFLEKENFKVVLAANAVEALHEFSQNPDVKLVISDVLMPGMNGDELLKQLLKINPGLKALFLSGKKHPKYFAGGKVLEKPYRLADVKENILSLLAK